jgi:peptidyl-prolyl cis-trans isomerase SurA
MNKRKYFFLIIFLIFFLNNSNSKILTNNVIVLIDNTIITELDLNKEINFLKFINKKEDNTDLNNILRNESMHNLIDRIIKNKEIANFKIEISEKEIEINIYNYLENEKIKSDDLFAFYKKYEIEDNYLRDIIRTDIMWSQLIKGMYENRININLTEVNKQIQRESKDSSSNEEIKTRMIMSEKNMLLNKFSTSHLEKAKKKYLIKFL